MLPLNPAPASVEVHEASHSSSLVKPSKDPGTNQAVVNPMSQNSSTAGAEKVDSTPASSFINDPIAVFGDAEKLASEGALQAAISR
eukprot:SAG31_NODE_16271_length_716_cov_0.756888_1_plen_86_part_00